MRLRAVFVAASICFAITPAGAAQQQPLAFAASHVIDNPVEQQTEWVQGGQQGWAPWDESLWVVNRTGCAWDVDDHGAVYGSGYLAPGASASVSMCMVGESENLYETRWGITAWWTNTPKVNGFTIAAPTDKLTVTACYSPQGECFMLPPRPIQREWNYSGCIRLRYESTDPAIVLIGDSGGGYGVVTTMTLTVTNPTSRKVSGISVGIDQVPALVDPSPNECALDARPYTQGYPLSVSV